METSTIATRVADLIRNPNSAMPSDWERSAQKKRGESVSQTTTPANTELNKPASGSTQNIKLSSGDALTLSPLAQKILEDSDSWDSEWDKNRNEQVQRIQQLVQDRQYAMSPEVVDGIAHKIVDMLLP